MPLADGAAVGFIAVDVDQPEVAAEERSGWITQVGTHPAWRGRGLGAALICWALRSFRTEGLARARLSVNVNNPHATEVYRRLGFTTVRRRAVYVQALPL